MSISIRRAVPTDAIAIRALLVEAFPSAAEADLVEKLKLARDASIALVAEDCEIVGYILFSRMDVMADGRTLDALGLAPVAVRPRRQSEGIGSALIEAGIALAREQGRDAIFVLGDNDFYEKFGFSAARARPFASRFSGPHFQAIFLDPDFGDPESGAANYARSFDELP